MNILKRTDLMSLEEYTAKRAEFRKAVMLYKKDRQLPLGENARLYFENKVTIQYQIQEVLRVEKTFDAKGIEEELEVYNELIPSGSNLKATFMLEFPDVEERERKTIELRGIENKVWLMVDGHQKVFPIANEDLSRDDGTRTSMVHFFRFEFTLAMISTLKNGASMSAGIDHDAYRIDGVKIDRNIKQSLSDDFDDLKKKAKHSSGSLQNLIMF